MGDEKLLRHRATWSKKRCLRLVYASWYKRIRNAMAAGPTVELGAGSGNFKEFCRKAVCADISVEPWLDLACDAERMPFRDGGLGNLVLIDVLHHLASPPRFLDEAARVLQPAGRIVLLEPYPSLLSRLVFARTHPEPFILDADPLAEGVIVPDSAKDPWQANQAVAGLMFFKYRDRFQQRFGDRFRMVKRARRDCLAYPASGGFEHRALLPGFLFPLLLALEYLLAPLRRVFAFRCFVVLERIASKPQERRTESGEGKDIS